MGVNAESLLWLLSTISQSSAALVAILGGFLLSRALASKSFKDSLVKEKNLLATELVSTEFEIDDKRKQVRELAEKEFFKTYRESFILSEGRLPKDFSTYSQKGLDEAELYELATNFCNKISGYSRMLQDFFHEYEIYPEDIEELRSGPLASAEDLDLLSDIAKQLNRNQRKIAAQNSILSWTTELEFENQLFDFESQAVDKKISSLLNQVENLQTRMANNNLIIGHLEKQIQSTTNLSGFFPALTFLAFMGLIGIGGPMVAAVLPLTNPAAIAWIAITTFLLLFVLFILFMFIEASTLKRAQI